MSSKLLCLKSTLVGLQYDIGIVVLIENVEHVIVTAGQYLLVIMSPKTLELVKNTVVLIQVAQLRSEMFVDWYRLDWLVLHIHIPDLKRQIVPAQDIPTISTEFDIRNRRDDLAEERFVGRILLFLEVCVLSVNWPLYSTPTHALRADHTVPTPAYRLA